MCGCGMMVAAMVACLVALLLAVLVVTSGGGSPSAGGDPSAGLPARPLSVPAHLPDADKLQAEVDGFFGAQSDCWHANRAFRVTMPELIVRLAEFKKTMPPAPSRAQREAYAQAVANGMRGIVDELLRCPPDARVAVAGEQFTASQLAGMYTGDLARTTAQILDPRLPLP